MRRFIPIILQLIDFLKVGSSKKTKKHNFDYKISSLDFCSVKILISEFYKKSLVNDYSKSIKITYYLPV